MESFFGSASPYTHILVRNIYIRINQNFCKTLVFFVSTYLGWVRLEDRRKSLRIDDLGHSEVPQIR